MNWEALRKSIQIVSITYLILYLITTIHRLSPEIFWISFSTLAIIGLIYYILSLK